MLTWTNIPSDVKQIVSRSDSSTIFVLKNDWTVLRWGIWAWFVGTPQSNTWQNLWLMFPWVNIPTPCISNWCNGWFANMSISNMTDWRWIYSWYNFKFISSNWNFNDFCWITQNNDAYCTSIPKDEQFRDKYVFKINSSEETVKKVLAIDWFYCFINNLDILKCKTPWDSPEHYEWMMMGSPIDFTMNNVKDVSSAGLWNELYILTKDNNLHRYATFDFNNRYNTHFETIVEK